MVDFQRKNPGQCAPKLVNCRLIPFSCYSSHQTCPINESGSRRCAPTCYGVGVIDSRIQHRREFADRWIGGVLAVALVAAGGICWGSYRADLARLRKVAGTVVDQQIAPSQQVLALLHWVHQNGGTARNQDYFVLPRLRATAVQVLQGGGDCADKSRLLASLLREVGIPSSMAMCFDAGSGMPVHTLVEARTGPGSYMLVDPAYDLYFPKPDGRSYYDLLDLRRDPVILTRRVAALRSEMPPGNNSLPFYLRASAPYETASTVNWNRNTLLSWCHDWLQSWLGDAVYRIPRPVILEAPKLFLATACLLMGASIGIGLGLLSWRRRRLPAPDQPEVSEACPSVVV